MSNNTNEIIFDGVFIAENSDEFIEKLQNFIQENKVEYNGKVLVFPIEDYVKHDDIANETQSN